MKKKIICVLCAALMLCACGNENREETSVTSTENTVITEEEKQNFATGVSVSEEETTEVSLEETTVEINNEIEERCPVTYTAHRSGVEYGEFSHVDYYSETCKMDRGFSILLPANYSEDKQYPVMYLLHGIFGNEYSFSSDAGNKIKEIVGNMAADGLIDETIIVCPNMYAAEDPAMQPGFTNEACLPYDNFINELINDVMPYVEANYSVKTGRENTYLAGFSMGGRETIYIALQKPELFGYVCAISAAPGIVATTDKFMTHDGMLEESEMKFAEGAIEPEVFMVCCGTRDSVVGDYPESYHNIMEGNGANHIWYQITGADHDNNAIQSGIYNIFKQIAYNRKSQ